MLLCCAEFTASNFWINIDKNMTCQINSGPTSDLKLCFHLWRTLPWAYRLFTRGLWFQSSLKKWPAQKPLDQTDFPLTVLGQLQVPCLYQNKPECGCFADWFLGDVECFKCSDGIVITIGAWSRWRFFEGEKDQIQTIQARVMYVFAFWTRIGNIRCLYEWKI